MAFPTGARELSKSSALEGILGNAKEFEHCLKAWGPTEDFWPEKCDDDKQKRLLT